MPFQCSNRLLVDKASSNAPNIEGVNANISYSVPDEVPFSIDHFSGKIVTKTSLDFETNQVFYVPVTAKDGGVVPRSASATATIFVQESVVKMNAIDFNELSRSIRKDNLINFQWHKTEFSNFPSYKIQKKNINYNLPSGCGR